MKKEIFEYQNYKDYLSAYIHSQPNKGRGFRSRIAEALKIQTAYVSQVLNGSADFSPEQALLLSELLGHTEIETEFFLQLIHFARAGSAKLKKYTQAHLNHLKTERSKVKNRLDFDRALTLEEQSTYYGSYLYAAIHIMLTIPEFQKPQDLARHLRVNQEKVLAVLTFLESIGLAKKLGDRFETGTNTIHLSSDSPLEVIHHKNWRMKCIQSLEETQEYLKIKNFHFSAVVSIAQSDVQKIRNILLRAVDDSYKVIHPSKEETAVCLSLDLFPV